MHYYIHSIIYIKLGHNWMLNAKVFEREIKIITLKQNFFDFEGNGK